MANHHIADTIAVITSIATTAATVATGIIAWAVYRYQRKATDPVFMVYLKWTMAEGLMPILCANVNIINRADAPLLIQDYSIEEPNGAWLEISHAAILYRPDVPGLSTIVLERELQPRGALDYMLKQPVPILRDRTFLQFWIFCPAGWPGGFVSIVFNASDPGKAERIRKITRRIKVGPPAAPKRQPSPKQTAIPH